MTTLRIVLLFGIALAAYGQTSSEIAGGGAPVSAISGSIGAPQLAIHNANGTTSVVSDGGLYVVNPDLSLQTVIAEEGSIGGFSVDADGLIYYSLPAKNMVKFFAPSLAKIPDFPPYYDTRYAGTGVGGYSGDGGLAYEAQVDTPTALVASGTSKAHNRHVYIADTGNHCIRVTFPDSDHYLNPGPVTDHIFTYAGVCGQAGYSGDGASAAGAMLRNPTGIAVDGSGNLYVADSGNGVIRMISSGLPQNIATLGKSSVPLSPPVTAGGPASHASPFSGVAKPMGVAVDTDGTVYYTDVNHSAVLKISTAGVVSAVAGTGTPGFGGDGGPASAAKLNQPMGISVDANHNLWIADTGNYRVRMIAASTGIITTVLGNGAPPWSGDGKAALSAQLYQPGGSVTDAAGNLYIADNGNYVVRKVDTKGVITTVAGTGKQGSGGDGGPATSASLSGPLCLAVAPDGSLLIGDAGNFTVRKVSGGTITTIAGTAGRIGTPKDGALASASNFGSISGLLYDASGNLLISDVTNASIYLVSASGGTIKRIAGGGTGGDGGPATSASMFGNSGMALDSSGNLFIADLYDYAVRRVDAKTGIITTVAGIFGNYGFAGDGGAATKALLGGPTSVAIDHSGNLLIADPYNNAIRVVGLAGNIQTYAGGPGGAYTHGGVWTVGESLNTPQGVWVDSSGNIYITDTGNNLVRKVTVGGGPAVGAVVNGGGAFGTTISPGEIVTLYGAGMGPGNLVVAAPSGTPLTYPTTLSGTQVTFNGTAAPLLYTYAGQIGAIVPYEVSGSSYASVQVSYQGQTSPASFIVPLDLTAPGFFTAGAAGSGQAAALNTDGTVNSASNPVHPGGVIVLFATGEGLTTPPSSDGMVSIGTYPTPAQPVTVTIGGIPATLNYAGEAPYLVSGVLQVNAVIPTGVQTGTAVPVHLQIGNNGAQTDVTIALH